MKTKRKDAASAHERAAKGFGHDVRSQIYAVVYLFIGSGILNIRNFCTAKIFRKMEIGRVVAAGLICLMMMGGVSATEDGLVAYWSFDNISGNIAPDEAGNNDGTIYGAKVVDGISGKALKFDGVDDYAELPDMGTVEEYPFSFEAWFKTSSSDDQMTILCQENSADWSIRVQLYFSDYHHADGELMWNVRNGNNQAEIIASGEYRDGNWHHVVGVSGASNDHKFYVDGNFIGADSTSVPAPSVNSATVGSWAWWQNNEYIFNGIIDEVKIYNRALTASEIKANYDNIINPPPTCTDDCSTSGTKTCTDQTHYKTCGDYDSDDCLEWSDEGDCGSGKVCENGNCVPAIVCGDGTCEGDETCRNCEVDCGICPVCESGENKTCIATNRCQGSQTCTNGQWSDCTTDLKKCLDGSCIFQNEICPVCESGETQNCIASNGCSGFQNCVNGQWADCVSNLKRCSDGSCVNQTETCPICATGDTRACTASNGCYGSEICADGQWGECTTTLKKCLDGSCIAQSEKCPEDGESNKINPPHFSSKALDADDKNPGRIAVQVTNIMSNPNLDIQIIMDVPDNVEVSGSTNVLEGKASYSTLIESTGTTWIEIPFTAKEPGDYRISMLIYWKWEGSDELHQVGFDHTVYVDKKQGEIKEISTEDKEGVEEPIPEIPMSWILAVIVILIGLAIVGALWRRQSGKIRIRES